MNKIVSLIFVLYFVLVGVATYNFYKPDLGSLKNTVRICSIVDGQVQKCGTGVSIGGGQILTAFHVVSPIDGIKPEIMVMKSDSNKFSPAILVSNQSAIDTAILWVGDMGSGAVLDKEFHRGERVWLYGNPAGRDFQFARTEITGVFQFQRYDKNGLVTMIALDSKDGRIRPGYSGAAVFSENGIVGILQLCFPDSSTCFAMPSKVIEKEINGELK